MRQAALLLLMALFALSTTAPGVWASSADLSDHPVLSNDLNGLPSVVVFQDEDDEGEDNDDEGEDDQD